MVCFFLLQKYVCFLTIGWNFLYVLVQRSRLVQTYNGPPVAHMEKNWRLPSS